MSGDLSVPLPPRLVSLGADGTDHHQQHNHEHDHEPDSDPVSELDAHAQSHERLLGRPDSMLAVDGEGAASFVSVSAECDSPSDDEGNLPIHGGTGRGRSRGRSRNANANGSTFNHIKRHPHLIILLILLVALPLNLYLFFNQNQCCTEKEEAQSNQSTHAQYADQTHGQVDANGTCSTVSHNDRSHVQFQSDNRTHNNQTSDVYVSNIVSESSLLSSAFLFDSFPTPSTPFRPLLCVRDSLWPEILSRIQPTVVMSDEQIPMHANAISETSVRSGSQGKVEKAWKSWMKTLATRQAQISNHYTWHVPTSIEDMVKDAGTVPNDRRVGLMSVATASTIAINTSHAAALALFYPLLLIYGSRPSLAPMHPLIAAYPHHRIYALGSTTTILLWRDPKQTQTSMQNEDILIAPRISLNLLLSPSNSPASSPSSSSSSPSTSSTLSPSLGSLSAAPLVASAQPLPSSSSASSSSSPSSWFSHSSSCESCQRGRTYAAIAVNEIATYSFYAPIVALVWYYTTGFNTHVNQVGAEWKEAYDEIRRHIQQQSDSDSDSSGAAPSSPIDRSIPYERALCSLVLHELLDLVSLGIVSVYQSGSAGPYDTTPVAQLSRTFTSMSPKFYAEDVIITADSDIMPLNADHFLDPFRKDDDDDGDERVQRSYQSAHGFIWQWGCCGDFEADDRATDQQPPPRKKFQRIAMSYIGASVFDWRRMIGSSIELRAGRRTPLASTLHSLDVHTDDLYPRQYQSKLDRGEELSVKPPPNRGGRLWSLDEFITSRMLQEWKDFAQVFQHVGGSPGRIDKGHFNQRGLAQTMPLMSDSHLPSIAAASVESDMKVWKEVETLIRRILPTQAFNRAKAYGDRVMALKKAYAHS